jgi:hypothetical protein
MTAHVNETLTRRWWLCAGLQTPCGKHDFTLHVSLCHLGSKGVGKQTKFRYKGLKEREHIHHCSMALNRFHGALQHSITHTQKRVNCLEPWTTNLGSWPSRIFYICIVQLTFNTPPELNNCKTAEPRISPIAFHNFSCWNFPSALASTSVTISVGM